MDIMSCNVPVWEKENLTVEEAAAYFGIGMNKIRSLTDSEASHCVLWVGSKRLIKRKQFCKFIDGKFSV